EHMHTALTKDVVQPSHQRGRVTAEVDVYCPRLYARQNPLRTQRHHLHLRRAWERSEGNLALHSDLLGCLSPSSAFFEQWAGCIPPDIVDRGGIASLQQIVRHASSHIADTNKTDIHRLLQR